VWEDGGREPASYPNSARLLRDVCSAVSHALGQGMHLGNGAGEYLVSAVRSHVDRTSEGSTYPIATALLCTGIRRLKRAEPINDGVRNSGRAASAERLDK
jgi:hypothetical protein